MPNEPVRGAIPNPSIFSLPGIEVLRTFLKGREPATPHAHLFGYRMTQVTSGSTVFTQPISPWFDVYDGFVDLSTTAEASIYLAASSVAPAGTRVRVVNLSLRYLRACTVENESVVVRSRVLHAGSSVTTVESFIEDALGRAVAHATGSTVLEAIDPPPAPYERPAGPQEVATYPTPDPCRRPLPAAGAIEHPNSPMSVFLGADFVESQPGQRIVTLRTSEWFCNTSHEVAPGVLAALASVASAGVGNALPEVGERIVTINFTYSFLAPVIPDGRELRATATLEGRRDQLVVFDVEIEDADRRLVLAGQANCLVRPTGSRPGQRPSERMLLTVLFTDLVSSTEQLSQLGDARYRELLDQHDAVVRRALDLHKGREVKNIGDGFLASFDSPTRAVRCARDIRDGVDRLGLKARLGLHTGECDVVAGDLGGVAVHVASRIQSAASPGEILVSATVRDLIAGAGITLDERPARTLKGLDGQWSLFAVA